MYMKIQKYIYMLIGLSLAWPAYAVSPLRKLENIRPATGYAVTGSPEDMLMYTIGKFIYTFLSILGAIFVILIIYAGYNWMTASGEEQKVEKAKDTIRRAIIGLIITVSASAIWTFVSQYLL